MTTLCCLEGVSQPGLCYLQGCQYRNCLCAVCRGVRAGYALCAVCRVSGLCNSSMLAVVISGLGPCSVLSVGVSTAGCLLYAVCRGVRAVYPLCAVSRGFKVGFLLLVLCRGGRTQFLLCAVSRGVTLGTRSVLSVLSQIMLPMLCQGVSGLISCSVQSVWVSGEGPFLALCCSCCLNGCQGRFPALCCV